MRTERSIEKTIFMNMVIVIIVGTLILGVTHVIVEYFQFISETKTLREEYIQKQKAIIEKEVTDVINYIEFEKSQLIQDGNYTDEKKTILQNKIAKWVSKIYYGYKDEQYIYIINYKGVELANGGFPELIGKSVWNLENDKGDKIAQKQIKLAKENPKGIFFKEEWIKKSSNKKSEKLYYIKAFPEWQWVVGTGIHTDEIEEIINLRKESLKNQFKKDMAVTFIMFLCIIAIIKFLTNETVKKINKNIKVFFSFCEKASKEKVYIDIEKINYLELKELALSLNEMIEGRNRAENEIIKVNNKLKRLSITDGLTGLYNHKYMYEILEKEIEKSREKNISLCVIMYDIDKFKRVNDIYGHQCGDMILKIVAETIKNHVGPRGVVGRYGGEEFLVILFKQNLQEAYVLGEEIRNKIKELSFQYEELKITISGGIVQFKSENPQELVNKADNLLYKAKEQGRDRIEK
ncbi:MAG: diguanylate cyclase [Anaeromicrobium sp.]|uniref:sensor domain-containing diguanylate cyclase n=1 Tax=Anaeromicrobium sp. TaxID=1929132 RepID=UPI0025E1D3FA|nr:diguanylate cyclase [Anaeromicrobium sp.]MCT4592977.1 diguanylate cyclase [Anaeromicrobium sp.]